MPAFDHCHEQVVRALQKDGWTVVQSPASLFTIFRHAFVDLEMSRGMNGRQETGLFVEVKCFPDPDNTTRDLYTSIGQYLVYRAMLIELEETSPLYLAVPLKIFETIFDSSVVRVIQESQIRIVVVDLVTETIDKWIK